MIDPLICCIMPTRDRPEMAKRSIGCFESQRYDRKRLLIVNSGMCPISEETDSIWEPCFVGIDALTVGALRNHACNFAFTHYAESWNRPDIIAHFDDDDYSAPERLQYQLDFMRSTGAPVVGFNDMLFYDAVQDRVLWYESKIQNYALGTSLFYKREAWERVKFPDQTPEDTTWQHQIGHDNIRGCSSIVDGKPVMIQVLHGANAAASGSGAIFQKASPEMDKIVREILRTA